MLQYAPPSSTAVRHSVAPRRFVCTWKGGGSRAAWVYVAGAVDLATSPRLKQALAEAGLNARLVVLDLREVTFIDSSGVHAIVDAAAKARRGWGRLVLVRGSAPVERMLTRTRLSDHILTFTLDPDEPSPGLLDVA